MKGKSEPRLSSFIGVGSVAEFSLKILVIETALDISSLRRYGFGGLGLLNAYDSVFATYTSTFSSVF